MEHEYGTCVVLAIDPATVRLDMTRALKIFGPFVAPDDAINWAEVNLEGDEWFVAPLRAQSELMGEEG
jgi:hypothetical protein